MKRTTSRMISLCTYAALFAPAGVGFAQSENPADDPPVLSNPQGETTQERSVSGSIPDLFARIDELDADRRAGLKAALLRQAQRVLPLVVVVDDAPSYLYAIGQWESLVRFPVLWDDGSVEARENIARFVRAFKPDRVMRLSENGPYRWSNDAATRQDSIESSLARALNEQTEDWRESISALNAQGIVSPGIVLTDPSDRAWPAALALAAGRFQPIGFMTKPADLYKPLEPTMADMIEREAERLAAQTKRTWGGVGDEIDAITLAMNTGTQIKTGAGARDRIATSDRIGRREHNGAGERWAWCGQIVGKESRTAYQAMCSLFLVIDQGFIWDGYDSNLPWSEYDGTQAGDILEAVQMQVELNDEPKNTMRYWEQRMTRPVGQGDGEPGSSLLMLMNSKGAANKFDLVGGQGEEGRPGDMPILEIPAAMHIVHSFSLQQPFQRKTVGGRLLERGVYAYAGSVDEPYLSGFLRTPYVAQRLASGVAFGTAIRYTPEMLPENLAGLNPSDAWKIAVLGDPLTSVGTAGSRVDAELRIDGLIDLDARVKDGVRSGDFVTAIEDLIMLGRDSDAARLAKALLDDKPEAFTPELALVVMPAMYRAGEYEAMVDCYERMDNAGRADGLMQDLLWLSSPYLLARGGQDVDLLARVEALLRGNLREGQTISDAERLAMHLRSRSLDAALGVLESLRPDLSEGQRKMLDRAITRVKR